MKINIKDRKTLSLGLCLILVCVFTLTVAYSALSAVLTINGNARVSAADWDIYLNNPRVTNGSATTDVPVIKTSSTLEFETTLNMPGDFYEFTVDVVNAGDIDAMIENVVKNPELSAEQAKFLKYEVSYQNGESITTKQLLAKDTTMPIKVRIEYRKDLVASDLPTGQVVLDLALTLEYTQSDGVGSSVVGDGKLIYANGNINDIGTIVTIGSEQFYTIGTDGDNVKLLAMYNLYVGNQNDGNEITALVNPTGMQSASAKGSLWDDDDNRLDLPWIGVTAFSSNEQKGINYSDYSGSIVEGYVNDYKFLLETNFYVEIVEARIITKDELTDSNTFACVEDGICSNNYPWIYSTSYWVDSVGKDYYSPREIYRGNFFGDYYYSSDDELGVRPVIVISKDYFN